MGGGKSKPATLSEADTHVRRLSVEQGVDKKEVVANHMAGQSEEAREQGRLRTNSETRDREEVKQSMKQKSGDEENEEDIKKRDFIYQVGLRIC